MIKELNGRSWVVKRLGGEAVGRQSKLDGKYVAMMAGGGIKETIGAGGYTSVYWDLRKYIGGPCSGLGSAVISNTSFAKRVVIHVLGFIRVRVCYRAV